MSTGEEFGMQKHLNLPSQDIPLMEGNVYMDDPVVGKVVASNLTTGKGGVGGEYTDERLGEGDPSRRPHGRYAAVVHAVHGIPLPE
ncbi:MAG: hypothetical protein MZV64_59340 [Ignavibacteriales bacterium]|nr:hypothetical protein [Ignavibacteriales bacterium]